MAVDPQAVTYDPTTPTGQVRLLISDTDADNATFTDADIQTFLLLQGQSVFRAAAMACESWARLFMTGNEKIGNYQVDLDAAAANLMQLAARYRQVEDEMPAFDVVEENLSGFNELTIIRNWVLRTEV